MKKYLENVKIENNNRIEKKNNDEELQSKNNLSNHVTLNKL